ncbi:MAG: efflux RND transporter permease subunit [Chloroflexota bacterium]
MVSGDDPAAIRAASDAIVADLSTMGGVSNVSSDLAAMPPPSPSTGSHQGHVACLTAAQVGAQVRSVLVGRSVGQSRCPRAAPPRPRSGSTRPSSAQSTRFDGCRSRAASASTALGDIATVSTVETQGTVTRVDGSPAATVSATITSKDQGGVSREAQRRVDALEADGAIPDGVSIRFAGATAEQNEAFGSLFLSMGVAILAVYLVMVVVFGSLVDPLVILFSLPLATIGAFPMLLVTGRPIGISALIGFLMLIGIVVTNAIVLLDLVEQLRHKGMSTHEALIQGGRTRVRPILMTAVATILAAAGGARVLRGSIIAAELGTVVIGGLFSSTVLTLIVIPVIYMLVDGGKLWASRRFGGLLAEDGAPTATARRGRRAGSLTCRGCEWGTWSRAWFGLGSRRSPTTGCWMCSCGGSRDALEATIRPGALRVLVPPA